MYVKKKERERRDALDKIPFKSRYFILKFVAKGAFGRPEFPWYLRAKAGKEFYVSGFHRKYAAQEEATAMDTMIAGIIDRVFVQMERKHDVTITDLRNLRMTTIVRK